MARSEHLDDEGAICADSVVLDQWHPISALAEIAVDRVHETLLLGEVVQYSIDGDGRPAIWRAAEHPLDVGDPVRLETLTSELPVLTQFGYLWCCLGSPPEELFEIAEFDEPDRRSLNAASIMVATSAPRAIENFLDMGHFPYVHTGLLGIEPRTEVVEYQVEQRDGELWATECEFYQPVAAASAVGGQMSQYTYRVPQPYVVMLYKSVPTDPSRRDVIALFVQPMTQELSRAHNFLCMVDDTSSDNVLKRFQQLIFSQDKPILENQLPKRLPLDPRAETSIRADKSAIMYRRWLIELGITYAVISVEEAVEL